MTRKRKRPARPDAAAPPAKRARVASTDAPSTRPDALDRTPLPSYYARVSTLRQYLLAVLPPSSRSRRRRILACGRGRGAVSRDRVREARSADGGRGSAEGELAALLDTAVVGYEEERGREGKGEEDGALVRELQRFSQTVRSTLGSGVGDESVTQAEVVDFAVQHLFFVVHRHAPRPPHLLCHGFARPDVPRNPPEHPTGPGIFGLECLWPNAHTTALKGPAWSGLLRLLGKDGDRTMLDLILHCGIFMPVPGGQGNLVQISGTALTELPLLGTGQPAAVGQKAAASRTTKPEKPPRKPSSIAFVRSRMMYARPALASGGGIRLGLPKIREFTIEAQRIPLIPQDALNRYPSHDNEMHTGRLLRYMFPRQFKLHNAFTSPVNSRETTHPFKDYTLREQEIEAAERLARSRSGDENVRLKTPKRLRGAATMLVQKLQRLHARCSYTELLRHYCPVPLMSADEHAASRDLVDAATPAAQVSAFCRAVLARLLPKEFLGRGAAGERNWKALMRSVDRFVHCRRYENLTLHQVYQGIQLSALAWLDPPNASPSAGRSLTDTRKRLEMLQELTYYIFDSILIPLLRANFYITESSAHQHRLFFFRHDVWKARTEPSIAALKTSMFDEVPNLDAQKILASRPLGCAQVRLVPKGPGVRPIMNLRRRTMTVRNGRPVFGRSINAIMKPVQSVLTLEKTRQPEQLGASLFSVGEIFPRLKAFKSRFAAGGTTAPTFYFVKVDVRSCFDTIPQREVLHAVKPLCSEEEYRMVRYGEIKVGWPRAKKTQGAKPKPTRRFLMPARSGHDRGSFDGMLESDLATGKKRTVFVESAIQGRENQEGLLRLLQDHVKRNIVRIGSKYHRQKEGIPQGSVVSSLLCNFFYAKFEQNELDFLEGQDSLLMRLIDDFLLITTDRAKAQRFLRVVSDGNEAYGIQVRPEKSLVNFDHEVDGAPVPRSNQDWFPYCGVMIDTRTLEITKDRDKWGDEALVNSLTIESSKTPGTVFSRKTASALRIQIQTMFTDTTFNSLETVLATLYQSFVETAKRMHCYLRELAAETAIRPSLVTDTIDSLVGLAFGLAKNQERARNVSEYRCAIRREQMEWLLLAAFRNMLRPKQTRYASVLEWLDDRVMELNAGLQSSRARLERIVERGK